MALIYTIPQNHVVLIKRLGKHSRVQRDGLRFKLPFIESVKKSMNGKGLQIKMATSLNYQNNKLIHHQDNVKPKTM